MEIGCPEPPEYGFIGRDGVILKLESAFQTETTVLLQGMAGVGKTETAVGFARWLAETGGLEGPIFLFSFEHYRPLAHVCDRVGQVFNEAIRRQLGQDWHLLDAAQRRQVALSILTQVPCLMIWDNFEPVHGFPEGAESAWSAAEQDELRGFLRDLRGGKTKVLITSRREENWLGSVLRPVELGGFKPVEAQELAFHVLRRTGVNVEKVRSLPQFNELLKFLAGNPLAIQVILPELKQTSPETLLAGLRSGAAKFGQEDPTQGRERSLTASLTYRLDSLDATMRKRLGILALFQGFVDADVLAAMCRRAENVPDLLQGLETEDWTGLLDSASQIGLLRRVGRGLYTMHPALPWFFHDLLDGAFPGCKEWFERALTSAYGEYGPYLNQMLHRSSELAMALLAAEEDNLMHSLQLARTGGRWDEVDGILYGLKQLLDVQGRWVEWERVISSLEPEVEGGDGQVLQGREHLFLALLGHRAEMLEYRRDFDGAIDLCLRLKGHHERRGDDSNVGPCLQQLGRIAHAYRKFDEAERWYRESLVIAKRIDDEQGQASTLHQLGINAQERRAFDEAERWYRESLAIAKRIGDEYGQALTLHQLGRIAEDRRAFDEAERWYLESLAIKERIGSAHALAGTLHQLGTIAKERGDYDAAERWYRQSLAIKERVGDQYGQAGTLHQLGIVAQRSGEYGEAVRWYLESLDIRERIHDHEGQSMSLHQLGRIAQERRRYDDAERFYRDSLAISQRIGDEHGQAGTLHQLGTLAAERGNITGAISMCEQAESIFACLNDPHSLKIVRNFLDWLREKMTSEANHRP